MTSPPPSSTVPEALRRIKPRGLFIESEPDGYRESDNDWIDANREVLVELMELVTGSGDAAQRPTDRGELVNEIAARSPGVPKATIRKLLESDGDQPTQGGDKGEAVADRLVDWTYLHATEGQQWPSTKTKSMLIARAMQGEPTQDHADGMKAAAPQPATAAYTAKHPADEMIGEIEKRFPDWKSYRDLVDCIDVTLHRLRGQA